jgi:hypothetical protein
VVCGVGVAACGAKSAAFGVDSLTLLVDWSPAESVDLGDDVLPVSPSPDRVERMAILLARMMEQFTPPIDRR